MTPEHQKLAEPPVHYGVLLYPGFEVLDIAGPVECLNTLSRHKVTEGMSVAVIARPKPDDPNTPIDLSPYNPGSGGEAVMAPQVYKPTHTFATAPPIDMLLIPGGYGDMPEPLDKTPGEVAYLKKIFPKLKYLLTICTGAGIAARAGVLDGKKATGNKAVWTELTQLGPEACWLAHRRWVNDGNVWTTSGVSAGTDGMVAFLSTVYPEEVITRMINAMEYNRVKDSHDDPFAKIFRCTNVCPKGCNCEKE